MPSDHFQDFDPEIIEPEPPSPEAERVLAKPSSDTPAPPVPLND